MIYIPFKPTPKQLELHNSPQRFKVAVFGRRSGKSTFALNEAIRTCIEKPGAKVWIVAPIFSQAKDIYWRGNDMLNKYLLPEMYLKKNDSELLVEFKNGSILQFKGADRPEVMRGSALDFVILDEIAEHRYARETWEQILLPSLSDKLGKALFIGTPKGYNFLYDLYERGQIENTDWKSWKVPTWESGVPWTLTEAGKAEIERLKAEMSEDSFMQEYGADFRKYTGLIFKNFDRNIHVKNFEILSQYRLENAQDFGFTNPTAVLFSYFDKDDNWFVFDEYYQTQRTNKDNCGRIMAQREQYKNQVKVTFADPEDAQAIAEYNELGWYLTPISKGKDSIINGINKMIDRFKINPSTREPKIFIHPRCENFIFELERYKWQEQKKLDLNEKDVPEDAYNHLIDCARYIINNHTNVQDQVKFPIIKSSYRPNGWN